MLSKYNKHRRAGGVYIAVLATALVVALLGISALVGQRLQNRLVVTSSAMRQAQLNANTAVELGLLTMKQDPNWRTTYTNGNWFVNRSTGTGTCTLNVTDPIDGNLANGPGDPVVVLGIGFSGDAEQRMRVTIDPRKDPLSCLRSAVAVGDSVTLQNNTLRTNNALITANQSSATAAQVYGKVEATTINGSTYNGTTTQITSDKRPTMPDWATVFNYYRTNGTQIDINSLPNQSPNLGRNVGIENGATDWTGSPPGASTSDVVQSNTQAHGGSFSLKVQSRLLSTAGAAQYIDSFVKSGQQYTIDGYVYVPILAVAKPFRWTVVTKGTGGAAQSNTSADVLCVTLGWRPVSATLTAPAWSGNLEYAYVKIAGDAGGLNLGDFYFDDLTIRETTTGRFMFRKVLSPTLNPFGGQTNAEGIYWINCNGNKIIIERSRIVGTLLLINPGAGSCITGPINWSPAVPGYPALLVDADNPDNADFAINATNGILSEKDNGVNYNPVGAPHDEFGQDADTNDIYRSVIRGLIAVLDDLTFQNRSLVRGQIIVGDDLTSSSGELEVENLPDSLLNPPPGFTGPYSYFRRPASVQKAVAP
jgi:Carbohydrate binding domain